MYACMPKTDFRLMDEGIRNLNNLLKIKNRIKVGQKLHLNIIINREDIGRSIRESYEGVVVDKTDYVFLVRKSKTNVPESFKYTDVLCGDVKAKSTIEKSDDIICM